ncbi:MAG: tRNA (guanosine(37)-N1)-methyltransferase TrmD [Oscillospiraceae bacterium]|nr:tRNA (guanosine(37)-N1)-methyltransferase TrmD [Oscillospiraceae bacterium]
MRFDILTLFPEGVQALLKTSIIGRAAERGHLAIHTHQIRDYTTNKQKQVDDYPFGGGPGMIMQAEPLYRCWERVVKIAGRGRTILLSPQGAVFDQAHARRLQRESSHLILVCGHYEGVDERFVEECVDEEISIGDFVLTGGEIPACALCDAVSRLIPGVLSDEACFVGESHWEGLLEYPQYSRPEVWRGREVPAILLSGHHRDIAAWRRAQSLERTRVRRPDLLGR